MISVLPFLLAGALAAPTPAPRGIPTSANTVELVRKLPISSARAAKRQQQLEDLRYLASGGEGHSAPHKRWIYPVGLDAPDGGSEYSINATIGTEMFEFIADTGSSDIWVTSSNFNCYAINGTAEPQAACNFGPNYFTTPDPGMEYLNYKNNFNISYGEGTSVVGYGLKDTVTVGGLSVPKQIFGLVDNAYFLGYGDGYTNGIFGLANPLLTSIFYGSNPTVDGPSNFDEYDPFFYTAVKDNLVEHPYFSLVINRATLEQLNTTDVIPNLGSITFGGMPNNVPVTQTTVTVPEVMFPGVVDGKNVTQPAWYTVNVDSFNFPGSEHHHTATPNVILDSGTTLIYVPDHVANEFNSHWDPPAFYSKADGGFVVQCNATAPDFSVTIGGVTFPITSQDLFYPSYNYPGMCDSTIFRGGKNQSTDIFILGDRFLVNTVTTFNIKTSEITITERQPY